MFLPNFPFSFWRFPNDKDVKSKMRVCGVVFLLQLSALHCVWQSNIIYQYRNILSLFSPLSILIYAKPCVLYHSYMYDVYSKKKTKTNQKTKTSWKSVKRIVIDELRWDFSAPVRRTRRERRRRSRMCAGPPPFQKVDVLLSQLEALRRSGDAQGRFRLSNFLLPTRKSARKTSLFRWVKRFCVRFESIRLWIEGGSRQLCVTRSFVFKLWIWNFKYQSRGDHSSCSIYVSGDKLVHLDDTLSDPINDYRQITL